MADNDFTPVAPSSESKRPWLTAEEREALTRYYHSTHVREVLRWLDEPFRKVLTSRVLLCTSTKGMNFVSIQGFSMCRRMMRDLDMTYWGFTWERLLPWWQAYQANPTLTPQMRDTSRTLWSQVTTTLFLMEILPYSERINTYPKIRAARLWLGEARATEIETAFLATARDLGYSYLRQVRKNAVGPCSA